jgi:DNA-binding LacI/PurR family transcriptional regulator
MEPMATRSTAAAAVSARPKAGGDTVRQQSSTHRAKARIVDWLASGAVAQGELLPSERVLSQTLAIGRGTLRRALQLVEAEGRITREGRRLLLADAAPRGGGVASAGPPWLRRSVAMLTPASLPDDGTARHWMRYTTLGIGDAVREAGLHAISINAGLAGDDAEVASLVASRPLGVLLPDVFDASASAMRAAAKRFTEAGVPVVVNADDESLAAYDRVTSDHAAGSHALTRWLLRDRGRRRPVRFWPRPWDRTWLAARSAGYERAMLEAGLKPPPVLESPSLTPALTHEQFEYEVRQVAGFLVLPMRGPDRPDALMAVSDRDVFALTAALRLLGLKPGEDVVVVGYDNYWPVCEERRFEPATPAASVDKQNEQMGREMVDLLLRRADGRVTGGPVLRRVEQRLAVTR